MIARFTKPTEFWERVAIISPDSCWVWNGPRDKDGYGTTSWRGKTARAHRVAYEIANNDRPELNVCHTCDNPPCCNPNHLFKGTQADNRKDCVEKGRQAKGATHRNNLYPDSVNRGDSHGRTVLKEQQIGDIWSKLVSQETAASIAREYQVGPHIVENIRSGRTWKHITAKMPDIPGRARTMT